MNNPIDILAKATGIKPGIIREIAKDVRENRERMKSCDIHDFSIEQDRMYYCSKCGGCVNAINKIWYEKGIEHANRNRNS